MCLLKSCTCLAEGGRRGNKQQKVLNGQRQLDVDLWVGRYLSCQVTWQDRWGVAASPEYTNSHERPTESVSVNQTLLATRALEVSLLIFSYAAHCGCSLFRLTRNTECCSSYWSHNSAAACLNWLYIEQRCVKMCTVCVCVCVHIFFCNSQSCNCAWDNERRGSSHRM